jgi:GNAT superfamily N-acetyltransferase
MSYTVSLDPATMQIDVIHGFLASTYWSPRVRRDVVERALRNSIVAGAFDSSTGRQVAFARVITDRATFAYLCDVFVEEPYRGRGISKALVSLLEAHPDIQTVRRWCLATRDAHGLYEQFGYKPVPEGRWMERPLPPSVWQDPPP